MLLIHGGSLQGCSFEIPESGTMRVHVHAQGGSSGRAVAEALALAEATGQGRRLLQDVD